MKIKVKSIKNYILSLIMIFFIIRPQFIITMYPENGLKILSFLELSFLIVIFVLSLNTFKRVLRSKLFIIALTSSIYIWIVTRIFRGTIGLAVYNGIAVVSAVAFILFFEFKYGYKEFVKFFNYAVATFVWVNLVSMFIFPEGIVRSTVHIYNSAPVFFMGQVNQFSIHLILSVILFIGSCLINSKVTIKDTLFCVLPVILTMLKDVATTAIVSIVVMVIGILAVSLFPNLVRRIERPVLNVVIVVIAFFFISRILALPFVAGFITNILGKDITLAARTTIWDEALSILRDKTTLLFGKGEISGSAYVVINTGAAFSAHNLLLQICFISGFVGLILFCMFFYSSIYRIEKSNQTYKRAIMAVCLLAFCLINMIEVYTFPMIYATILVFDCFGKYLEMEKGNMFI